jgi:hypothetical protein
VIHIPVDASGDPDPQCRRDRRRVDAERIGCARARPRSNRGRAGRLDRRLDPHGEEPYGQAYFPISLGLVLPVIGAALAFRAVSKRSSAKVVNRAMYVTLFGTLLNAQLVFVFLPTVVGIGIAAFQVRKAEVQGAATDAAEGGTAAALATVGVIEVDEVDEIADHEDDVEADELAEDDSLLEAEDAAEPGSPSRERPRDGGRSPASTASAQGLSDLAEDPGHLHAGLGIRLRRGVVRDLLGQPPQRERHRVGLGLGHVDAIRAESVADLLLLERQRLSASHRVQPVLQHRSGRLGDDANALAGVHLGLDPRRLAVTDRRLEVEVLVPRKPPRPR